MILSEMENENYSQHKANFKLAKLNGMSPIQTLMGSMMGEIVGVQIANSLGIELAKEERFRYFYISLLALVDIYVVEENDPDHNADYQKLLETFENKQGYDDFRALLMMIAMYSCCEGHAVTSLKGLLEHYETEVSNIVIERR